MAGIRMHLKDTYHFITNRCEQEQLLMLPSERVNEIIACWFSRALTLFGDGLEIYAFIFLSNHFHLLCRDTKGTLARFMCYFQGNLARAINKELGRRGKFWGREYDDVIVDGDAEFLDRYAYTLCNAVKAGLVDRASEWIGWSSLEGALHGTNYRFEMLNVTRLYNATRRGQQVEESDFTEVFEFELSVPPMWADKSQSERAELTRELIASGEHEYRSRREFRAPLGLDNILKQRPFDRPLDPSLRPRIKVFSLDRERRKELLDGYRRFCGGYRDTLNVFYKAAMRRRRAVVEWPDGSYPPSSWLPMGHTAAA